MSKNSLPDNNALTILYAKFRDDPRYTPKCQIGTIYTNHSKLNLMHYQLKNVIIERIQSGREIVF